MKLTHFSLFSGIGGIDLSAEWAGFETVGQCEFADYPTKVLEKHWPDVPRWRDIRDVTLGSVRDKGVRTIDLITGGFPCQPFSVAGKQRGKEDDRYLWPEMLRVIRELTPSWVIGENVPGIMRIAGDDVCQDLEREGYEVGIYNFEAAAVGAKHRRERIFFVAHSTSQGLQDRRGSPMANTREKKQESKRCNSLSGRIQGNVADTEYERSILSEPSPRYKQELSENGSFTGQEYYESRGKNNWDVEPDVGRVANGIPSRVDRLKCLGNAVVPQQVYPILKAIADIEKGRHSAP
jgi:DNA (cytosine-5)-methyltransferase 1